MKSPEKYQEENGVIVPYSDDRREFFKTAGFIAALAAGVVDCKDEPSGKLEIKVEPENLPVNKVEIGESFLPKVELIDKHDYKMPSLPPNIDAERFKELCVEVAVSFEDFFKTTALKVDQEEGVKQLIALFKKILTQYESSFKPFLKNYTEELKKRRESIIGYMNHFLVRANLILHYGVNVDTQTNEDGSRLTMRQSDFDLYRIKKAQKAFVNEEHVTDLYVLGEGVTNSLFMIPMPEGIYSVNADFDAALVWQDRECIFCSKASIDKKMISYHEVIHAYIDKRFPFIAKFCKEADLFRQDILDLYKKNSMRLGDSVDEDLCSFALDEANYLLQLDELCAHGANIGISEDKDNVMRYFDLGYEVKEYALTSKAFIYIARQRMADDPTVTETIRSNDIKKIKAYLEKQNDIEFFRGIGRQMFMDGILTFQNMKKRILYTMKDVKEARKRYEGTI